MTHNRLYKILVSAFVLIAALLVPRPGAAQEAKQPYPTMAPVEQYLMDRDAEIALARSAAPDAISKDASDLRHDPTRLRNRCERDEWLGLLGGSQLGSDV